MNRKSFSIQLIVLSALMAFASCDELEPADWTESVHRVATVRQSGSKVSLAIDYSGESFNLKNFSNESDMARFGVQDGDRVIASMTFSTKGSAQAGTFTLDSVHKLNVQRFEPACPSDTLNFYYEMDVLELGSLRYPAIWNAGHIINLAPVFFTPDGDVTAEFSLFPIELHEDTLIVRMYSYIPDDDVSLYPKFRQKIVSCDISSLTDSVADPIENARRRLIMNNLRNLQNDHINVRVVSPVTLRAKNSKNPAGGYKYNQDVQLVPQNILIPFDF